MAGKDIIMASQRELKRLQIVEKVVEGSIRQAEAAEMLSLGDRQVRRVVRRIREEGAAGVVGQSIEPKVSGRAQRASNRTLPAELRGIWADPGPGEAS